MPIWNYESLAHPFDLGFTAHLLNRYTCFYCKSLLQDSEHIDCIAAGDEAILKRCNACGWWYVEEIDYGSTHMRSYGGFARLKALDINDIATPTEEARSFLLAQYKKRHEMHPRLFEETVGSIMRELGYATRVTAYHGDNGIDIYLDGPNGTLIGVQVKRWKHSIKIEQIHSLGGALLVNRCTKGNADLFTDFAN